jgi:hypothetical protein
MYTYFDRRRCNYCGAPIEDQASKSRKFCRREDLPDGTVQCCKDDFHTEKNKDVQSILRRIGIYHRLMNERIAHLFSVKGENVSLEDINRAGINLYRPVQFKYINEMYKGWFLDYLIEQQNADKFKISTHEHFF